MNVAFNAGAYNEAGNGDGGSHRLNDAALREHALLHALKIRGDDAQRNLRVFDILHQ